MNLPFNQSYRIFTYRISFFYSQNVHFTTVGYLLDYGSQSLWLILVFCYNTCTFFQLRAATCFATTIGIWLFLFVIRIATYNISDWSFILFGLFGGFAIFFECSFWIKEWWLHRHSKNLTLTTRSVRLAIFFAIFSIWACIVWALDYSQSWCDFTTLGHVAWHL